ncbi:MAG: tripartite tricarboxylate transporter TctB family protein [Spirochaetaceae bacterium]|nr:tripartite tricarboxylate transporter TctB family protein [Spirochaetaceae bacterium]
MERRNLIIAIIFTCIGIILLVMIPFNTTTRAPKAGYTINVNPRTFPYILSIIMTSMGLFNVIISARAYKKSLSVSSSEKEKLSKFDLKSIFPMFLILLMSIIILPHLGYIISTFIACTLVALFFKARWWSALLLGVLLSLSVYFLFSRIGVPLPRGILYFL